MKKEIDVLYIHPTKNLTTTLHSFMPVGIIGLLNILKQGGYKVFGINYGIEKSLNSEYDIETEIKNISYKVLLIDLHWYEHSFGAIETAKISKKLYPNVPVVIGGMTTTIFAKEILENFDVIDYALKGDSEKPIKDLVDYLLTPKTSIDCIENIAYRKNTEIIDKSITYCCESLDELDNISDDFIKNNDKYLITNTTGVHENRKKNAWITIGRGCLYNCTYCDSACKNNKKLWGREGMLISSPEKVADDIIQAYKKGAEVVRVTHDLEMLDQEYYEKIFEIIKQSGTKIGFNYDSFQLPSIDFINKLINTFDESNTIIDITVITASDKIRNKMGKQFSNKQLLNLLDYLKETKAITRIYYSINVENETMSDFYTTIEQIQHLANNYASQTFYINYERVILDPLATMRDIKYNNVCIQLKTFMDYYEYCKFDNKNYTGYIDNLSDKYQEKVDKYNIIKQEYAEKGYYNIY